MSYTLRGRIETRLAAAALPVLIAALRSPVLHVWWPLELAGLMLGIGLALDVALYHPLLPYQPGWAAVPLGLLELGAGDGDGAAARLAAPLGPAVAFFAGSWPGRRYWPTRAFRFSASLGRGRRRARPGGIALTRSRGAGRGLAVLGTAWLCSRRRLILRESTRVRRARPRADSRRGAGDHRPRRDHPRRRRHGPNVTVSAARSGSRSATRRASCWTA